MIKKSLALGLLLVTTIPQVAHAEFIPCYTRKEMRGVGGQFKRVLYPDIPKCNYNPGTNTIPNYQRFNTFSKLSTMTQYFDRRFRGKKQPKPPVTK